MRLRDVKKPLLPIYIYLKKYDFDDFIFKAFTLKNKEISTPIRVKLRLNAIERVLC